jgi:hypothetical protein
MEILLEGEGAVMIRFIDANGETLMQERLVVSGSPTVQGRRSIALAVQTKAGMVMVAPVLVNQSNPKQRITFDDVPPAQFTRGRCKEIGCSRPVMQRAIRGRIGPSAQLNGSVRLSDDAAFVKYVQAAAHGASPRE